MAWVCCFADSAEARRVADYPANTAAGLPSHEGSKLVESWVENVGRLEAYLSP